MDNVDTPETPITSEYTTPNAYRTLNDNYPPEELKEYENMALEAAVKEKNEKLKSFKKNLF